MRPDLGFIAGCLGGNSTWTLSREAAAPQQGPSLRRSTSLCKSNAFLGKNRVGGDGEASHGWRAMGGALKGLEQSAFDGDPWAVHTRGLLDAAGVDWSNNPTYFVGVARWGWTTEQIFRIAAALDGGLTRVNLMVALRNIDMTAPFLLPGASFNLNGSKDAYLTEASEIVIYNSADQAFNREGEVIDISGTTPPCAWLPSNSSCGF